ncbi:MAG: radical SAM protein [bacterium]
MRKTRLALIIPPVMPHRHRDPGSKQSLPHIGIGYLASNVDHQRTEVVVMDCPIEQMTIGELLKRLLQYNPDFVGFTAYTFQINEAAITAAAVKKVLPHATTLIGGYHATPVPVETLKKFPSFDVVIHGEGEQTLNYLIDAVSGSGDLSAIEGVCYRNGDQIKLNPSRALIQNLDTLSFPAYNLMPMGKYKGYYTVFLLRYRPALLLTARGCPYQCTFCYKLTGSKYRVRSIDSIMEEIKRDLKDFNVNQILITDESFTLKRDRVILFCERLLGNGIMKKIKWVCQTRVDHVDAELLKLMKRAGCHTICFGVESGNQEILDKIGKNMKLDAAEEAIRMTKHAGILTFSNFIIGLPYETKQTVQDTINFAIRLDSHMVTFALLTPYPGTKVVEMAKKGIGGLKQITDDYSKYGKLIGGALELEGITRGELEKYHRNAYLRFYLRPSKFFRLFLLVDISMLLLMLLHKITSFLKSSKGVTTKDQ